MRKCASCRKVWEKIKDWPNIIKLDSITKTYPKAIDKKTINPGNNSHKIIKIDAKERITLSDQNAIQYF